MFGREGASPFSPEWRIMEKQKPKPKLKPRVRKNCKFARRSRDIDWDLVASRVEEGFTLPRIANELNMPYATLWRRFAQQFHPDTLLFQKMRENTAKLMGEQQRRRWTDPNFRQKQIELSFTPKSFLTA